MGIAIKISIVIYCLVGKLINVLLMVDAEQPALECGSSNPAALDLALMVLNISKSVLVVHSSSGSW